VPDGTAGVLLVMRDIDAVNLGALNRSSIPVAGQY
jgi:hypothetical protein